MLLCCCPAVEEWAQIDDVGASKRARFIFFSGPISLFSPEIADGEIRHIGSPWSASESYIRSWSANSGELVFIHMGRKVNRKNVSHQLSPWADRMHVALGFSSASPVRVVHGIHRHSPHRRSNSQPALTPRFTQLRTVVVGVAGHADGGTTISMDPSHLAALQSNIHVAGRLFGRIILVHHHRKGACAPAELSFLPPVESNVIDNRPGGDHVQR